jgi:hypothetical protein
MKNKLVAVFLGLTLAASGLVYARPSFSSGGRSSYSSSSSSRSSSSSSTSRPAPSYNSTPRSPPPPSVPTFSSSGYQSKSTSSGMASPRIGSSNTTVIHEHHYFGSGYSGYYGHGYYGGYGGGFGNSPFFWLWLFDRPTQQQVVVAGDSQSSGVTGTYVVQGPSFWTQFFNIICGLFILALIGWAVVAIFRFFLGRKR